MSTCSLKLDFSIRRNVKFEYVDIDLALTKTRVSCCLPSAPVAGSAPPVLRQANHLLFMRPGPGPQPP